ncbi:MAG TPA: HEAT repeat domain-containing protein [Polyangia bacterium]|nr:HEAT repeat domain-containing protein [Polyangia bacterium]
MRKKDKRWIIAGALAVVTGITLLAVRHTQKRQAADTEEASRDTFQGFSSRPFSASGPAFPPPPETPESIAQQVASEMDRWRSAIVNKDAGAVIALDMAFRQNADRYVDALAKSAESEPNERVRAFSTRVLGKMKRADLAPTFQKLLVDKSPYVRQNAAWALGELGGAAAPALAELRHAARDSAHDVRLAAQDALGKVE